MVKRMVHRPLRRAAELLRSTGAQNALEYLLVVGAVVIMALVITSGFADIFSQFIGALCPSVDPVGSTGVGQCLGG